MQRCSRSWAGSKRSSEPGSERGRPTLSVQVEWQRRPGREEPRAAASLRVASRPAPQLAGSHGIGIATSSRRQRPSVASTRSPRMREQTRDATEPGVLRSVKYRSHWSNQSCKSDYAVCSQMKKTPSHTATARFQLPRAPQFPPLVAEARFKAPAPRAIRSRSSTRLAWPGSGRLKIGQGSADLRYIRPCCAQTAHSLCTRK